MYKLIKAPVVNIYGGFTIDDLNIDEAKVIQIIESNGFIINRMSRENLGFGKTKYLNIFNKLIDEEKIEKVG